MVIVPAVCLGLFFVFFVGFVVTHAILGILKQIENRKMQPTLFRDIHKRVGLSYLTENEEEISIVGGGIAVVLVIILMIIVPREWTSFIWYGLTAIGILAGISTFFLFESRSDSKAKNKQRPADTQKRQESGTEHPNYHTEYQARVYDAQRKRKESERERKEHQVEYQARVYEIQRKQAEIQAIKDDLYSLFGISDDQSLKRERLLEGVLNRFFKANDILVKEDFKLAEQECESTGEHVEGVIEIDGCLYLVEMKWWKKPLGSQEVTPHLVRVFNRGYSGGVLMTNSNFNQSAITTYKEALSHKTAVLCELEEIVSLLERNGNLKDFLKAKIAAAVVDKNPLFRPIS